MLNFHPSHGRIAEGPVALDRGPAKLPSAAGKALLSQSRSGKRRDRGLD